ncbi:MAG: HAD hydrolase family protein, partial [Clostridia bacterium]|nr:HAD hydrolase family protein [Clostridia bacterium]
MLRRDLSRARASRVAFLPRSEWGSLKWYKLVVRAEPGEVDALRADIESAFPGRYCLSKSGSTFFELQSKDTDKAFWFGMLREYAEKRTGIPPVVIAAGDYENDLPMLRAADVGVCPANATEEVKREADFCLCTNTEGLIGDIVEQIEILSVRPKAVSEAAAADGLFVQAVDSVVESGRTEKMFLQRTFGIGYNRAFRLIESMERCGIIRRIPGQVKPYTILISSGAWSSLKDKLGL